MVRCIKGIEHGVKERRQRTEDRGQNFEFRIAKPGTRPKGGSPKDNFVIGNCKGGYRIGR